ncbi:MAG TPA: NrfD/PsrC family molybdoenzyme membrane anchor subunit [Candidatus Methylomirabilis sp.]|nr:NrfD/PsrC family molybdoenzyme membrane anchor subunit [Candidatus Methylomirabilis sp.]HSC70362.1 NrfD/PsrC family molybdoenzyme membrane anchor subunit [Candidatus Methylomirabilis sp.]
MTPEMVQGLSELLEQITGFIYPNEIEIHWSILIVVYPYITGLVAGAFILASLVKVFNVKEVQPTYRLSLLTALAFLLVAPFPLLLHLGHPERSFEIFLTPNLTSAMAMFGFVYAWYLMGVLLLEIWFEYRSELVIRARTEPFPMSWIHRALSLFTTQTSQEAVAFDKRAIKAITIIGIPSAFLLHGYVGFIFGSVKANPWWGSVLMPIVFLMSAIVSGIALVIFLYMILTAMRREPIDMRCLDTIASFLFYAVIVDFSLEALDFIHRLYQSEESVKILGKLITHKLFMSLFVLQILLGMFIPLGILIVAKWRRFNEEMRKLLYFTAVILIQLGIFSTRWNVVIGGQLFSKSFRGLMAYKMEVMGLEGLLTALVLLALPFIILAVLIRVLPTRRLEEEAPSPV